jgi:hypothetical protein
MIRTLALAAALTLAAAAPVAAQVPVLDIRAGGQLAMPTGDFKDAFESGYGFYGRVGIPLATFKLFGAVTWTRFSAPGAGADSDFFTIQAGPHVSIVPLADVGLEVAYITEAEEFGISPSINVGFSKLELTASYTTTFANPASSWLTVGLGIRF